MEKKDEFKDITDYSKVKTTFRMMPAGCMDQPVSKAIWVHRDGLVPNDYNPNSVAPPELDLLEISILEDGWTQPIVAAWLAVNIGAVKVKSDVEKYLIVDGFHRYLVSGRPKVYALTKGYVPVAPIECADLHAMQMATIRHNRARGTHGVVPMASIVGGMIKYGMPMQEIMHRLQMEKEEVVRLASQLGIPQLDIIGSDQWSQAWAPK